MELPTGRNKACEDVESRRWSGVGWGEVGGGGGGGGGEGQSMVK